MVNSEDEGAGRNEQGHDFLVINSKGEGAGRAQVLRRIKGGDPKRKTHLVTDAFPCGIAASLYQEDDKRKWEPVDLTLRELSMYEQGWDSQIHWKSLAKVWGMMMFRSYLIGVHFTS